MSGRWYFDLGPLLGGCFSIDTSEIFCALAAIARGIGGNRECRVHDGSLAGTSRESDFHWSFAAIRESHGAMRGACVWIAWTRTSKKVFDVVLGCAAGISNESEICIPT